MAYARRIYMEQVLQRRADGTLGVAEALNSIVQGGLSVLEWRVFRLTDVDWVLIMQLGEKAQKAPAKAKAGG